MGSPSDTRITPFETARETLTTPAGTEYDKITLNFAGQDALVYAPTGTVLATHTSLVLMCHGYVDTYGWIDPTQTPHHGAGSAMSFVDQGWIVVSHHLHGNNWGNDQAIADLLDCYVWAAGLWWIDHVVLLGFSMGGMTVYNTLGHQALPDVSAAVTVNGVVNIRTNWLDEAYRVYGGTSESDLDLYMQGHDPARDSPARWAGSRIFMSSSPNDSVCPTPDQAQVFYDRVHEHADLEFRTHTSGHLAQSSFMVPDVIDWLHDTTPAYVEGQSPDGVPFPWWQDAPDPVDPGGAIAYTTGGQPAVLYTTAGGVLTPSRA